MTPAEQYRARAGEFKAKARSAESPDAAAEWNRLANCYLRLAEEAERNSRTDMVYESGPAPRLRA
jgi:hypothetical protein